MDPVSIVIGIVGGAVVGFLAFGMPLKGKLTELQGRFDDLTSKHKKTQASLDAEAKKLKETASKADDLKQNLDKTKKNLKKVEDKKKETEQQAAAAKSALTQAEEKARSLEGKAKDLEGKVIGAESKIKQVEGVVSQLKESADSKAKEVNKLKKDLAKAGGASADYAKVAGDLNGILKVLCEHETQEAAVLSDANGIVIASVGDSQMSEGVAAAARRITKISSQLQGMVDLGDVTSFRLGDVGQKVISGRAFNLEGEMVAVATVGVDIPSDGSLEGAVINLTSALSG